MSEMTAEVENALRYTFGYVPSEHNGEQWTVFRSHTLIVIHPERKPRFYKRGAGGNYYEMEPDFL